MTRKEYNIINLPLSISYGDLLIKLNALGLDGWELVHTQQWNEVTPQGGPYIILFLMRDLVEKLPSPYQGKKNDKTNSD